jgi:hypothetical protein
VKANQEYMPFIVCGLIFSLLGFGAVITGHGRLSWWAPEISDIQARAFGVVALSLGIAMLIIGFRRRGQIGR